MHPATGTRLTERQPIPRWRPRAKQHGATTVNHRQAAAGPEAASPTKINSLKNTRTGSPVASTGSRAAPPSLQPQPFHLSQSSNQDNAIRPIGGAALQKFKWRQRLPGHLNGGHFPGFLLEGNYSLSMTILPVQQKFERVEGNPRVATTI